MRSNSVLQLDDERPGLHQAAAWRDAVAPFWSFAIRREDVAEFRGRSHVQHLGNAILCRAGASGLRFTRDRALVARMGVDHILAHVRLSGRSRVEAGGAAQDCGPGDICLLDLSRPLAAQSTDYQALTVVLPRGLFGADQAMLDALHGQVIRGASPFGRMLNDHLRALDAHAPGFSERESGAAARATAVLLGAAVSGLPAAERNAQAPDGAPLLLALRRFIEAELASPDLNAETLGRQFGISRSALYRLFVPLGGVAGYIRQRRLARAYRDLAAGDGRGARISEVAYRWGFESPAHFAQAFRFAYGHAPRDVRAQGPAEAAPGRSDRIEAWGDFYDWVLKLAA
ncbi:helix-turn-helix domain-containing protein [Methylobacterium phyllostachyos]|uniref:helix-turn-helix domain-containing protein n=1 Tax=Methylobacterium phyllostachyos TaxID=582672 RepID=UPI000A6CF06E|nr:helix-turn-helix domain-containing protein [Methylobacterium phyllostachyos]